MTITCTEPTAHYASGRKLLEAYSDINGIIQQSNATQALTDYNNTIINNEEYLFILDGYMSTTSNINYICSLSITCTNPTAHYASGRKLLEAYSDINGIIQQSNITQLNLDANSIPAKVDIGEWNFVQDAYMNGTNHDIYYTCPLGNPPISSITISAEETTIQVGKTTQFTSACTDISNNGMPCDTSAFISTDITVGNFTGSTFYAIKAGTTDVKRITNNGVLSNTITMTVTESTVQEISSITISSSRIFIPTGETEPFTSECKDINNNGMPCDTTQIFISTDTNVGYMSGSLFYAIRAGTTAITCIANNGVLSNTIHITVTDSTLPNQSSSNIIMIGLAAGVAFLLLSNKK